MILLEFILNESLQDTRFSDAYNPLKRDSLTRITNNDYLKH